METKFDENVDVFNCFTCNKSLIKKEIKKCSKCKYALYCSKKCQIDAWKEHKKVCTEHNYFTSGHKVMTAELKKGFAKEGIENKNNEEYKHAETVLRKMLRQTKGTFMEQDALHDLASSFHLQGRIEEAIATLNECIKLRIESRGINGYDTLRSRVFLADITSNFGELKSLLSILEKDDEEIHKFRPVPPDETNRLKTVIMFILANKLYSEGKFDEASVLLKDAFEIYEYYDIKDDMNYPILLKLKGLIDKATCSEADNRRELVKALKSIHFQCKGEGDQNAMVCDELTGRESNILHFLKEIQTMIDSSMKYYNSCEFEKAKLEINNVYHKIRLILGLISLDDITHDEFDFKALPLWNRSVAHTVGNVTLKLMKTFLMIESANNFKKINLMLQIKLASLRDEIGDENLFNW